MKKHIILSALALAASAMGLQAQDASDIRVYINPGHGSWTPDDRPSTLVGRPAYSRTNTDTLGFFESNTNLQKGFGMLEHLIEAGFTFDRTLNQEGTNATIGAARDMENNIVMSRVKNGPYHDDNGTAKQLGDATPADLYDFNRNLGEICEEVDANMFDYYISIHSNAATEGTNTNYPLFLYRGYDTPAAGQLVPKDFQDTSREMINAAWPYAYANTQAKWTAYSMTNVNKRGDINFYGGSDVGVTGVYGYLGALKHHSPGYLVEGYFHTYQPARHRAMNDDVSRLEGTYYARGLLDYLGLDQQEYGTIYGVVRDLHEKFKDDAYKPNATTSDAYKPLNGVKVVLKKDGTQVAEYTTDNYYNGAFVFSHLAPGKYTIEVEHEQYLPLEAPLEVEVKANVDSYPEVNIVNKDWVPPTVIYENYPDVVVPGTLAADEYEFRQNYVDEAVAELEGKTVRRMIAKGEKLYILAHDQAGAPSIVVYDAAAKTVLANVSVAGTQGSESAVSDIQLTADGVLVATNHSFNQFSNDQVDPGRTRGTNYIYHWENDENGLPTGDPKVLGSSQLSGNFYRATVGATMAYTGTLADGKIVVPAVNASEGVNPHKIFYNLYTVVDGEFASAAINNKPNANLTAESLGEGFTYTTSPLDPDNFVVTSTLRSPGSYEWTNVETNFQLMPAGLADGSTSTAFFRYNKHAYMVTAENTDNQSVGFRLNNVTDGFNKAVSVGLVNTSIPAGQLGAVAASVVAEKDVEENVTAAYLNLYIARDGKISHLTTNGVTVAAHATAMAYDLASAPVDESTAKVTFKASADAVKGTLVLTDAETAEEQRIDLGAVQKGENSVDVNLADLEEGHRYNWAVELASATNPVMGKVYSEKSGNTVRGGVVTITDPTQSAFGKVAVAFGKAEGFDIYDPAQNKLASRIHYHSTGISAVGNFGNASDPFRGSEFNGYAIFPCWGDKANGIIALDLNNHETEPFGLIGGTNDGTGCFVLDGVKMGGGSSGACILGTSPDDMRLYSHAEDVEGKNGDGATENSLWCYELNSDMKAVKAPVQLPNNGFKGQLANKQAELVPYGNGFFAVQNRGAGNNVAGCPGFIYYDATSNAMTFSSHVIPELISVEDAMAIRPDGKMAAVSQYDCISFFNVEWNGATPSFSFVGNIKATNPRYTHMNFDYAGNLHFFCPGDGYSIYAPVRERPVVSVPARAEYALVGGSVGIGDITVDGSDNEAPAVYYNLQGIRMNPSQLAPGIYIRLQGKTSEKVIIK